jgi:hypothetical protein
MMLERGREVSGNGCGFCYFIQAMDHYSQERMCDDGGERGLCMQEFPTGQLFPTSNHARRGEEDQPAAKRLRTRRTNYIIFTTF